MEPGTEVWVRHKRLTWAKGIVRGSATGSSLHHVVQLLEREEPPDGAVADDSDDEIVIEESDMAVRDESATAAPETVNDLIQLSILSEAVILRLLEARFSHRIIYTTVGAILLAVNPFKRLPLYGPDMIRKYLKSGSSLRPKQLSPLSPHVYTTADSAFSCMSEPSHYRRSVDNANQSIITSGESGAGKTETTKIIMQYLATVSTRSTTPVLMRSGSSNKFMSPQPPPPPALMEASGSPAGVTAGAGSAPPPPLPPTVITSLKTKGSHPPPPPSPSSGPGSGASAAHTLLHSHSTGTGRPLTPNTSHSVSVEQRVLESNPILEAFGNAKTLRNDNSSRFGKYISLLFDAQHRLVGATIVSYLLEKVRVVSPSPLERNYHILYQLVRGADSELRDLFHLSSNPTDYEYLTDVQLSGVTDADEFVGTKAAMDVMGISTDQNTVFQLLAAILHLGNVKFTGHDDDDGGDGGSGERKDAGSGGTTVHPDAAQSAAHSAELLGVSVESFVTALTTKRITAGRESYTTAFSVQQATDARDGLAKDLYGRLFLWLVDRINQVVAAEEHQSFIGVLDIFGFEYFERNSFEQLCINYANESLQQQFNIFVFKMEAEEYAREGIQWTDLDFPDSTEALDLIDGRRPPGLLALLDEQCLLVRVNDKGLAEKYYKELAAQTRFKAPSAQRVAYQFTVVHYAGDVVYDVLGFSDKNKDQTHGESLSLCAGSSLSFLSQLYTDPSTATAASTPSSASTRTKLQSVTLGSQFKTQLASLMTVIRSTTPHYIRCLKPNERLSPLEFNRDSVVRQLRCGGVLEAVRVSRLGFPVRMSHSAATEHLYPLVSRQWAELSSAASDDKDLCVRVMGAIPGAEHGQYQIGSTKLFFRTGLFETLEVQRLVTLRTASTLLQAFARRNSVRLWYLSYRAAAVKVASFGRMATKVGLLRRTKRVVWQGQRLIRGFLSRRRVYHLRCRLGATAFQAAFRRHVSRRRYMRVRRVIMRLQATHRMHAEEERYYFMRIAAETIQSTFRGWRTRATLPFLRQQRAMRRLTAFFHVSLHRARLRRFRRGVTRLQATHRQNDRRTQFLTQKAAAVTIQRVGRGFRGRQTAHQHRRAQSASLIGRTWRVIRDRRRGARFRAAVVKLQAQRKAAVEHQSYLRTRSAVVTMQALVRGVLFRVKWRRHRRHTAASAIQRVVRGLKGRREATELAGMLRQAFNRGRASRDAQILGLTMRVRDLEDENGRLVDEVTRLNGKGCCVVM